MVRRWPLRCSCGRVYRDAEQQPEAPQCEEQRRGKPVIAKGKKPGG